jgi:hypothetical protein
VSFTGSFDFSSGVKLPSGPTSFVGSKPADWTAFHAAFTSTTFFDCGVTIATCCLTFVRTFMTPFTRKSLPEIFFAHVAQCMSPT